MSIIFVLFLGIFRGIIFAEKQRGKIMKKLVSFIAGAVVLSSAAVAAPSMVKSNANDGGYVVTYDYRDKPTNGWYTTVRAELAFWNFKY